MGTPQEGAINLQKFRECFETFYPAVLRQLTYLTGERAVAEDLAQELFLKMYTTPPGDFSNPGGWLAKSAIHLGYNYLRGEKRRQRREEYVGVREILNVIPLEELHLRNHEVRQVRQVLASMSARDRMLLLLKFSGYSYEEIAAVTGVRKTSVGTLLARAQSRFRHKYCRQFGGETHVVD